MMDEAFMPFHRIIADMLSLEGGISDDDSGVRSYIYEYEIDSPVEFDISRDQSGELCIGSTPPIYYVDTSIRPSFHRLRFISGISGENNGDG